MSGVVEPSLATDTSSNSTQAVTVSVEHLDFSISSRSLAHKCLPCFFSPSVQAEDVTTGRTRLLKDINFIAKPAQLTAIIGPSGCGKTTLLNVIADRARGRRDQGTVKFCGIEGRQRHLSNILSLVYANDRMLPYLTVTETLMFAATLRLGKTTIAKRREKVETVMRELALTHVKDTPVGGVWKKGLSTGEMRRLSIAQELITKPAVLLLDEPTSGLDSVLAYEVMYVLRQVAKRGRTVICTIHQPRSSVFELFDDLVVLGQGRCLYAGPAQDATLFFSTTFNVDLNAHESASEFLIDLASESTREVTTQHGSKHLKDADLEPSTEAPPQTTWSERLSCINLAEEFRKSARCAQIIEEFDRIEQNPNVFKAKVRNAFVQWWLEFYAVAYRSFRNSYRNPLAFVVVFFVQVFVGLFLGAVFFRLPSKYLPDQEPIYVGDENSAAMKAFDTTAAKFFSSGIDQTGYNPLLEMLVSGADGNGSQPFDDFAASFISGPFADMPECTWRALELGELEKYAPFADLSEYRDVWEPSGPDDKVAPDYVEGIIHGLQVLDYVVGDVPWNEVMQFAWENKAELVRPVYLWPECVSVTGEVLDVMAICSGVYPRPPHASDSLLHRTCGLRGTSFRSIWINQAEVDEYPGPEEAERVKQSLAAKEPEVKKSHFKDIPATERTLQAASIIGAGAEAIDFLPPVALQMFAKVGEYIDVMTSCPHAFCEAMKNMMNDTPEGTSIGDYGSVLGAVMNIAGALFFSIANVGFASYDALVSFPQERVIFNREVANKMYKPSSYFLGKSLSDLVFQFMPAIGLVTTFYFLVDLGAGPNGEKFFKYLAICILVSFTSYGFAYFLSALSKTMEMAVVAAPLTLVVFICCSGFFIRDSAVPDWMAWVKYLSLYRWGFFALMINQFPPGGVYWGLPNSFSLALAGITETRIGVCVGWLLGLGIAFRILTFLALRFTNRKVGIES